ncbi:hypothetical protein E3N88_36857 [Mikania micrantha]|uniref:Uncharacterized protein n=1 Tax=Mikania micrantha TaxID=192012 RepID=A0A5N6M538_9ASTR|nr:hypothetical protein E3N88_36857 [Mikania micrantha]
MNQSSCIINLISNPLLEEQKDSQHVHKEIKRPSKPPPVTTATASLPSPTSSPPSSTTAAPFVGFKRTKPSHQGNQREVIGDGEKDVEDKLSTDSAYVMLQGLSKTNSTKIALNQWVFGEEVASQLGDVEQYPVPSNSVELAYMRKVTTKVDVFSFEIIMIMEFITRKRPTGLTEDEGIQITLPELIEQALDETNELIEILDPDLASNFSTNHGVVYQILQLALCCA